MPDDAVGTVADPGIIIIFFWFESTQTLVWLACLIVNTKKKYHVFAPMGRFKLESILRWKIKVN